jgi:predicted nucleic acid-binding protein
MTSGAGVIDPASGLGAGECGAIALAASINRPVLLDDRAARRFAQAMRLRVIGSAGILLKARQAGLISAVAPVLELWGQLGIRLADELRAEVLRLAGEAD